MNGSELRNLTRRLTLLQMQVEADYWKVATHLQTLGESAACADFAAFEQLAAAFVALGRAVELLDARDELAAADADG
jgi:predicted metalloprotease with PDZ domain